MPRDKADQEQFYKKLQHKNDNIRIDEEVIVMDDLDDHLGTQRETCE